MLFTREKKTQGGQYLLFIMGLVLILLFLSVGYIVKTDALLAFACELLLFGTLYTCFILAAATIEGAPSLIETSFSGPAYFFTFLAAFLFHDLRQYLWKAFQQ